MRKWKNFSIAWIGIYFGKINFSYVEIVDKEDEFNDDKETKNVYYMPYSNIELYCKIRKANKDEMNLAGGELITKTNLNRQANQISFCKIFVRRHTKIE